MPSSDVYPDLVRAAGGPEAVVKLAEEKLVKGKTVEALHLSEVALEAAPENMPALRAQLNAYEKLLEESQDENHYEVFWLCDLIKQNREKLGLSE